MKPEPVAPPTRRWSPIGARVVAGAVLLLVVLAVLRQVTGSPGSPPAPATRAHAIGERLACPICQGETVADSPSVLAGQMRGIIAEQVGQGKSDAEIEGYFVERYGPSILLAPAASGFSLLAWLIPALVLGLGASGIGIAAWRWTRRRPDGEPLPALTPEEQERYATLLAERLAAGQEHADTPGAEQEAEAC